MITETLSTAFNFLMHIDKYLATLVQSYGWVIYPLLFLIIFCETGLVIAPFLPGDSMIFAAGALAGAGMMNVFLLFFIFSTAAILGDSLNYWIGSKTGPKIFKESSRFFKREYLLRTEEFYEKHGGKAIVLARFMPILRTFAPFVAGIAKMSYPKFIFYNISGGLLWVGLFVFGGFFFGELDWVKNNFFVVIIAIVIISVVPVASELIRHKINTRRLVRRRYEEDVKIVKRPSS